MKLIDFMQTVCCSELWRLALAGKLRFDKVGRWWNIQEEIDIVALESSGSDIVFAECKYRIQPMDTDVFYDLLRKKEFVPWKKETRLERFALFSISGFTDRIIELAKERGDLLLIGPNGEVG